MIDHLETERLILFPYTSYNLHLFNTNLKQFEKEYDVYYYGEELDHLLTNYLIKLEEEIKKDNDNYLFFTEFLIVLKTNSHIIGSIDFKYIPINGITEVGYGLNPKYEGNGYMSEALKCFLEFGKSKGIKKVLADTIPDNYKSQKVLKKCGFNFIRKDKNLWWMKEL